MIKAYVDGLVHVNRSELSPEMFERLTSDYNIVTEDGDFPLWEADDQELTLPWSALKRESFEIEDRRVLGMRIGSRDRLFSPREGQEEAVASLVEQMRDGSSGNFIAPCASGKTIIGAEVALRWGRRTAVLVHKRFLARQWEKAFGILAPDAKIGWVKQNRCEYEDKDVILVMCQSLTSPTREYPSEMFDSVGLVICDEVHRYGAKVWQGALKKFPARRRLGLTATFRRRDGLLRVIEDHLGGILRRMEVKTLPVRVHFVKISTKMAAKEYTNRWDGSFNRSRMVNLLASNEKRTDAIVRMVVKAADSGRKIVILSERLHHLDDMADGIKKSAVSASDIGFFVGGKSDDELDEAAERQVIFATYQMAKEGLDIPAVDTLILATPVADVEQSVGRIVRPMAGKREPVVVDFLDENIGPCSGFGIARRKQYRTLGYEIP